MQKELNITEVEQTVASEQPTSSGPVLLQPEMLAWISGGAGAGLEELPKGTW